jgi:hypothetical protein
MGHQINNKNEAPLPLKFITMNATDEVATWPESLDIFTPMDLDLERIMPSMGQDQHGRDAQLQQAVSTTPRVLTQTKQGVDFSASQHLDAKVGVLIKNKDKNNFQEI